VLKVRGKGGKTVLVPLPPAVARAVDRAVAGRSSGPLLLNRYGTRMDRQAATGRLAGLAGESRMRMPALHPHMLRARCTRSGKQARAPLGQALDGVLARVRFAAEISYVQPRRPHRWAQVRSATLVARLGANWVGQHAGGG
jgi:integrase